MTNFVRNSIYEMQDTAYRDFHSRLIPDIDKELIVGVRTPALRKLTKELSKRKDFQNFLSALPHKYYEENNIHGFYIQSIKSFDECIALLEQFLPYIDNWATCDMLRPVCFKNNTDRLYPYILKWLNTDSTYTVRFAIGMLNSYYLDSEFCEEHLKLVSSVKLQEYYVKMMVAWYFATALTKQYYATIPYIENHVLDVWTHNKSIQKSIESHRIPNDRKEHLKSLKFNWRIL